MPTLPFQAASNAWATDASLPGVDHAHLTCSIRPCCSAACRILRPSGGVKSMITPPSGPARCTNCSASPLASEIGTSSSWTPLSVIPFCLAKELGPELSWSEPGTLAPAVTQDLTPCRARYCDAPSVL